MYPKHSGKTVDKFDTLWQERGSGSELSVAGLVHPGSEVVVVSNFIPVLQRSADLEKRESKNYIDPKLVKQILWL